MLSIFTLSMAELNRRGRFAHIRRIDKNIPVVRCLYDGGTVYLQDNEYETPKIVEPVKLD